MIALRLYEAGYEVTIYTKGPDPRLDRDAEQYGSTGNGRMGRFITGFEGETYLSDTLMYPNMKWAFQNPISEGGWLGKPLRKFSAEDQAMLGKKQIKVVCIPVEDVLRKLNAKPILSNVLLSAFVWPALGQDMAILKALVGSRFAKKMDLVQANM